MTLLIVTSLALIVTIVMFAFIVADNRRGTFASGIAATILWSIVVIFAVAYVEPWTILLGSLNAVISLLNVSLAARRGV